MTTFNINPFSRYDYVNTVNPAVDTNPPLAYVSWLNITTGEEFVCTDNTAGASLWTGSLGTYISPTIEIVGRQMFTSAGVAGNITFTPSSISGAQAGDLAVVGYNFGSTSNKVCSITGYTPIAETWANASFDDNCYLGYKWLDSPVVPAFSIPLGSHATSFALTAHLIVLRNCQNYDTLGSPLDLTGTNPVAVSGTGGNINFGSIVTYSSNTFLYLFGGITHDDLAPAVTDHGEINEFEHTWATDNQRSYSLSGWLEVGSTATDISPYTYPGAYGYGWGAIVAAFLPK